MFCETSRHRSRHADDSTVSNPCGQRGTVLQFPFHINFPPFADVQPLRDEEPTRYTRDGAWLIISRRGWGPTWNSRNAYPFGGKYDLDSALCGQSTTSAPYWLNDVVISSANRKRERGKVREIGWWCGGVWVGKVEGEKKNKNESEQNLICARFPIRDSAV